MVPLEAGSGRAPALVVLGAPRSGTTSLASYLKAAGVAVGVKDSFYLMDDDAGLRGPTHLNTHGVDGYLDLFSAGVPPTVEVAAGYLYQKRALEFFAEWRVPPTFAVILRDPVERLRSVHRYFSGNLGVLPAEQSFADYVDNLRTGRVQAPDKTVSSALDQGRYDVYLEQWRSRFGPDRIVGVNFSDLEERPGEVTAQMIALAGANSTNGLDDIDFQPRNQSYVPRSRVLSQLTAAARHVVPAGKLRQWGGERIRRMQATHPDEASALTTRVEGSVDRELADYYAPHNQRLARRYSIDISRWT